jgi:hypothetical protein
MTLKVNMTNGGSTGVDLINDAGTTLAQVRGYDDGSSNGHLELYTTSAGTASEKVRIDKDGNVGIGTNAPTAKLEVSGQGKLNAITFAYNTSYYNTDNSISNYSAGNYLYLSGNSTGGTGGLYLQGAGNQKQAIIVDGISTGGNIAFQTNGSERARIDSSGNLLVGMTSQSYSSQGASLLAAGTVTGTTPSGTDSGVFYQKTSTTSNVVISTWSDVGGTRQLKFYVQANGTTANASDATLKKNIEPARGYLSDLQQIEIVKYNWVTDDDETPKELGVIAQQVETVFPGMVGTGEDGKKLVKYGIFVPMLVKAIQEQQALITQQAAALTQLQADVAALKGQA